MKSNSDMRDEAELSGNKTGLIWLASERSAPHITLIVTLVPRTGQKLINLNNYLPFTIS